MRRWCVCALVAIAAVLSAACDDEASTDIDVVVVDTAPGLSERPDTLRLEVTPLEGAEEARSWSVPATYDGARLSPWSQRVSPFVPNHPGRVLYRFRAIALRDGAEVVRAQARLVFVPGARIVLPLRLSAECVGRECGPAETCVDGACVDDFVPACSLLEDRPPPFCETMDASPRDSGARDTGTRDVGPVDLGSPDTSSGDLGPTDSGPLDMGPPDARSPDAGPRDLGPPDTGPRDLGPPDMGPPDTGPVCGAPVVCGESRRCECDPACATCDSTCDDGTDPCFGTCTAGQVCTIVVVDSADSSFRCEEGATCDVDVRGGDDMLLTCATGARCNVTCTASEPDRCELRCEPDAAECVLDCGRRGSADCALDCGAALRTRCDGGVSTCSPGCPPG